MQSARAIIADCATELCYSKKFIHSADNRLGCQYICSKKMKKAYCTPSLMRRTIHRADQAAFAGAVGTRIGERPLLKVDVELPAASDFLDRTKGHRRRWCTSTGCGKRAKVPVPRFAQLDEDDAEDLSEPEMPVTPAEQV